MEPKKLNAVEDAIGVRLPWQVRQSSSALANPRQRVPPRVLSPLCIPSSRPICSSGRCLQPHSQFRGPTLTVICLSFDTSELLGNRFGSCGDIMTVKKAAQTLQMVHGCSVSTTTCADFMLCIFKPWWFVTHGPLQLRYSLSVGPRPTFRK